MSFILDTLATVRKLQASGFSEDQAEAVTNVVREAQDTSLVRLATKADLGEIKVALRELEAKIEMVRTAGKADLRESELRLEARIETAKSETVRWLVMTQAALAGFIVAVLKFLH